MQYEHTQLIGYRPLGSAIISTGLGALVMAPVGVPSEAVWLMIAVVLGTAVLFGSLTVRVTDERLIWYFGPRFWRNTLSLDAIKRAEPVQTSWVDGWGIRMLSDGGLYNVSGFEAVEIETTDGAVVRIGTDEPERLADVLTSRVPDETL